jgi:hypothetical protein
MDRWLSDLAAGLTGTVVEFSAIPARMGICQVLCPRVNLLRFLGSFPGTH